MLRKKYIATMLVAGLVACGSSSGRGNSPVAYLPEINGGGDAYIPTSDEAVAIKTVGELKTALKNPKVQESVIELQKLANPTVSLLLLGGKPTTIQEAREDLENELKKIIKDLKQVIAIVFFIENAEPLSKDGKTIDVDKVFATIENGVKEVLVLVAKGEEVFIPANTAKVKDSVLLGNTFNANTLKDALVDGSAGSTLSNFFFKSVSADGDILTFVVQDNMDEEDFTFKSNEFKKASDGTLYGEHILLNTFYYACPTKKIGDDSGCGTGNTQEEANAKVSKANFKGKFISQTTATIAFSGNTLDTPLQYSNFGYIKNEDDAHVTGDIVINRPNDLKHATVFSYGVEGKAKDFATEAEFNGKAVAFVECQPESNSDTYVRQFNGEAKLNIGSSSSFEKTLTITLPEFGKITYIGDALPTFDQASLTAGTQYDVVNSYSGTDVSGGFTPTGYGDLTDNPSEAVGTFVYSKNNYNPSGNTYININGSFGVTKQ